MKNNKKILTLILSVLLMGASCDDKETSDDVNNPENQTEQNNSDNNSSTENGKVTEWKDGYITFYGQPDNNDSYPYPLPEMEKGYYNVFLQEVELFHYERKSRGFDSTPEKKERFKSEEK